MRSHYLIYLFCPQRERCLDNRPKTAGAKFRPWLDLMTIIRSLDTANSLGVENFPQVWSRVQQQRRAGVWRILETFIPECKLTLYGTITLFYVASMDLEEIKSFNKSHTSYLLRVHDSVVAVVNSHFLFFVLCDPELVWIFSVPHMYVVHRSSQWSGRYL